MTLVETLRGGWHKAERVAEGIDRAMVDSGTGGNGEQISSSFMRWLISLMIAGMMGMAGIIWSNLSAQISEIRADTRALQVQVTNQNIDLRELKSRVNVLLDTLTPREPEAGGRKLR